MQVVESKTLYSFYYIDVLLEYIFIITLLELF